MKKVLSLALILLLIATFFVGCTPKNQPAANTDPKTNTSPTPTKTGEVTSYKDGTYTAKDIPDEKGWTPEITITVKDGKITEVKYDEVSGMKKSKDTEYQKNFKEKSNVDLLTVYKTLQDNLLASQDINKIDGYTGATNASNNFKELVVLALENYRDGDKYKDGKYRSIGKEDERGWKPELLINIKDGKITEVTYDEISSKTFMYKSKDTDYQKKFMEQKNIDLLAVYDTLQKSLIDKQDPAQVDGYTGATSAHTMFIWVAGKALSTAR